MLSGWLVRRPAHPPTLLTDLMTRSRCLRSAISTVIRMDPRWSSPTLASTFLIFVLMSRDARADVGEHAVAVLDGDRQLHGVPQRVAPLVPLDVDAALGIVHQVDDVRTVAECTETPLPRVM